MVSNFAETTRIKNVREVILKDLDVLSVSASNFNSNLNEMINLLLTVPKKCSDSLGQKEVQELKKEKFDIVLLSKSNSYCYLSLVQYFKVSIKISL